MQWCIIFIIVEVRNSLYCWYYLSSPNNLISSGSTWSIIHLMSLSKMWHTSVTLHNVTYMSRFIDSSYSPHGSEYKACQYQYNTSFHHLVVCFVTGPKPLPKRALHIVQSRASSFKWEYPLLSLRSSNSFLHLPPCLPVTSIPPCIFPSLTRCRRQFRRKMWPIQFRLPFTYFT